MTTPALVPKSVAAWRAEARRIGVDGITIYEMKRWDSASEIGYHQYLLLKVLWLRQRKDRLSILSYHQDWIHKDVYEAAKISLERFLDFRSYHDSFRFSASHLNPIPFPNLGTFSLARYDQCAALRTESSEDAVSKLFSPVAAGSRGAIAAADQPSPSRLPKPTGPPKPTSTIPATGSSRDTGRLATLRPRATGHQAASRQCLNPPEATASSRSTGRQTTSQEATGREAPGPSHLSSVNVLPLTPPPRVLDFEQDVRRKNSLDKPVNFTEAPSPVSPMRADYEHHSKDEAIINSALVSFLSTITRHFNIKGYWTLHRQGFKLGDGSKSLYTARVDGYLQSNTNQIKAIIEVKPVVRARKQMKIEMQEGAQMAAWISEDPGDFETFRKEKRTMSRLLISQDYNEVFLTFGTFDADYVDYVRGKKTKRDSFLRMNQFGPYKIFKQSHMTTLAFYILAFSQQQCA